MKVVLFGATGMVGQGVLHQCLTQAQVTDVLVVGRSRCGVTHPKLRELVHADLYDYTAVAEQLTGYDACFFCLGVSSSGMTEAAYRHVTYDLTLAAARMLLARNLELTFIYVSGDSTDSTEQGRVMWARVKGATENALLGLGFKRAFMFRPGYIQPLRGIKSRTAAYRIVYSVFGPLYPVLKALFPRHITNTDNVGRAMLRVAADGYAQPILKNADINQLAGE